MRSIILIGASFAATALFAQTSTWTQVGIGQPGPSARHSGGLAYDAERREVVLFGGKTGTPDNNETWIWNGQTWAQRFPAVSPNARHGFAMAYDRINKEVVLHGGYDAGESTEYHDTWTWNGSEWQLRPASVLPVWYGTPPVMTWDPVNGQIVLFNGLQDLWGWKDRQWRLIGNYPSGPSVRRGNAVSWDPASNRLLVFAGGSPFNNETWLWQPPPADSWTKAVLAESPVFRYNHTLAVDPSSNRILLFGGSGDGGFLNDTWRWTGAAWIRQSPLSLPPARWKAMMAADEARGTVVLFGGQLANANPVNYSDTWVWSSGATGWWRLDDGRGSATAADSSGNGLTGALVNSPLWITGRVGEALRLNGTNWVDLGNPAPLRDLGAVTVSAWIKASGLNNNTSIVEWDSGSWDFYSLQLKDGGTPSLSGFRFSVRTNQGLQSVFQQRDPAYWPTDWYMLTGSFDPAARVMKLYFNGQPVNTVPLGAGVALEMAAFGTQKVYIGGGPTSPNFIGDVDDARIWNRALTDAEVAALYIPPPAQVASLSLTPSTVTGGSGSTGRVTLTGDAPYGGTTVALTSSDPAATVPPTVLVPQGFSFQSFAITTSAVSAQRMATISATYGTTAQAVLTVNPAGIGLGLALDVAPAAVTGGTAATGTARIAQPAPASGVVVLLSSSIPVAASVPSSVTIAAGATSANFAIATYPVATQQSVTITEQSGEIATKTLVVNPAAGGSTPLGWWKLDEGSGSNAADSSGNGNNGIFGGSPAPSWMAGRVGSSAIQCSGGYVDAGGKGGLALMTALSVSLWIKPGLINDNAPALVWENGSWDLYSITIKDAGSPVLRGATFTIRTAQGPVSLFAPMPSWNTDWQLITATFDPASRLMRLYRNGQQWAETTAPIGSALTPGPYGDQKLYFCGAPGQPFFGAADDVRVYGRALTESEVAALVGPAPSGLQFQIAPASVVGGASATGTVTIGAPAPVGGVAITLTSASNPAIVSFPPTVTIPANATFTTFTISTVPQTAPQAVTIRATRGSEIAEAGLAVLPSGSVTGLAAWWRLDSSSGITAYDASGNDNTGTFAGSPWPTWIPGRAGTTALQCAGGYVDAGSKPVLSSMTAVSVSAWVKPGMANDGAPVIVWENGSWDLYSLTIKDTGSASLRGATFGVRTVQGWTSLFAPLATWNAEWYLITATFDPAAGVLRLYRNGQPWAEGAGYVSPLSAGPFGDRKLYLCGAPGQPYIGGLDEPRVYSRPLTPAEAAALYTAPPAALQVTVNPTSVIGGTRATGTVSIGLPAPGNGVPVVLSTLNPAVANFPPGNTSYTITIPYNQTSVNFDIDTFPQTSVTDRGDSRASRRRNRRNHANGESRRTVRQPGGMVEVRRGRRRFGGGLERRGQQYRVRRLAVAWLDGRPLRTGDPVRGRLRRRGHRLRPLLDERAHRVAVGEAGFRQRQRTGGGFRYRLVGSLLDHDQGQRLAIPARRHLHHPHQPRSGLRVRSDAGLAPDLVSADWNLRSGHRSRAPLPRRSARRRDNRERAAGTRSVWRSQAVSVRRARTAVRGRGRRRARLRIGADSGPDTRDVHWPSPELVANLAARAFRAPLGRHGLRRRTAGSGAVRRPESGQCRKQRNLGLERQRLGPSDSPRFRQVRVTDRRWPMIACIARWSCLAGIRVQTSPARIWWPRPGLGTASTGSAGHPPARRPWRRARGWS